LCSVAIAIGCGDDDDEQATFVDPSEAQPAVEAEAAPSEEDLSAVDQPESAEGGEGAAAEAETEERVSVATVDISTPGLTHRPLPEKMGNRIRSTLRETHRAVTLFRESIYLAHDDGRSTVYAIYEFSEHAQCTNRRIDAGESRRTAYRTCRHELFDGNVDFGADAQECTKAHFVRAELEAPRSGRPADWGGEITIAKDVELTLLVGCVIDEVEGFALTDLDGDDTPELAVTLTGTTPQLTFRDSFPYAVVRQALTVLRVDDFEPQVGLTVGILGDEIEVGNQQTAGRVHFEDDNGDERPDLIHASVNYDEGCFNPETDWPIGATSVADDDCYVSLSRDVWPYDPESDTWTRPSR